MSNRVRVQLQQGSDNHIDGFDADGITADKVVAALKKLLVKNKKYKADSDWEKAFSGAVQAAIKFVENAGRGGGFIPLRGSGNVKSCNFTHPKEKKPFRVDIECHGVKDVSYFGK